METWSVVSEIIEIQTDGLSETIEAIERSIWSIFARSVKVPVHNICGFSREEGISLAQASSSIWLMTAANSQIDFRTKQEIQLALDDFNNLKNSVLLPPTTPTSAARQLELLHIARGVKATLDACCMILIGGFTWEQLEKPPLIVD